MNSELREILFSFREWATNEEGRCKGDLFNLIGSLNKPWQCNTKCNLCPVVQIKSPKLYPDQIISIPLN